MNKRARYWAWMALAAGVAAVLVLGLVLRSGDDRPSLRVAFVGHTQTADGQPAARFAITNRSSHLVFRQGTYGIVNRPPPPGGELLGNVNGYKYLPPGEGEEMIVPVLPGEGEWKLVVTCYRETRQRRFGIWVLSHRSTWGVGALVRLIPLRYLGVTPEWVESDPVPVVVR